MTKKDYVGMIENLAIGLNTVNPGQWRAGETALTAFELAVVRSALHAAGQAFAYAAAKDNPRFDARRFDFALCEALGITSSDYQPAYTTKGGR